MELTQLNDKESSSLPFEERFRDHHPGAENKVPSPQQQQHSLLQTHSNNHPRMNHDDAPSAISSSSSPSGDVSRRMTYLTTMAAIGGFLFGYDTGVISGAMLSLKHAFALSARQQEVVVSSTVLAAFGSSLVTGSVSSSIGRKPLIRGAAAIFTLGSFVLASAWSYESLVFGRLIVGVGIGIASLTTPVYIAEVATPDLRGRLVTINTLLITVGQFVAGMIDGIFLDTNDNDENDASYHGWRYMLGLAAVPSIIMWIGFGSLPESPRWLVTQGRIDEARSVLSTLRSTNIDAELQDIILSSNQGSDNTTQSLQYGSDASSSESAEDDAFVDEPAARKVMPGTAASNNNNTGSALTRFRAMWSHAPTRRALVLGCGIMAVQQCSGINTVMYYAATIYQMSGFEEGTAVWLSGFTALAQVTGIATSIVLVDRAGRRTLVLSSLAFVTLSLMGLALTFYGARVSSDPVLLADGDCQARASTPWIWDGTTAFCYDCGSIDQCGYCPSTGACIAGNASGPFTDDNSICAAAGAAFDDDAGRDSTTNMEDWKYDACTNPYGGLSVLFMVLYLLAFGIGMGGMPWTINSEIYPLRFRSLAVSCSTATNWIGNLVVSATFLSLSSPDALTAYGAFGLYGMVALVGFGWLFYALPETKGLSLEEIESLFVRTTDHDGLVGEYRRHDSHEAVATEENRTLVSPDQRP